MQIIILVPLSILCLLMGATFIWFAVLKDTIPFEKYYGGITALLALLISGVTLSISLSKLRPEKKKRTRSKGKKRKRRGSEELRSATEKTFADSVLGPLLGGVLGGGLAGLIIGIQYYFSSQHYPGFKPATWDIIPKVITTVVIVAGALGFLCQLFMRSFRRFAVEKRLPSFIFNEVTGGVVGGLLAGPLICTTAWGIFGERKTPPPDISMIFGAGTLAVICIVFGVLVYDNKLPWRRLLLVLVVSGFVALLVFHLADYTLAKARVDAHYFLSDEVKTAIERGVELGLLAGVLWGFQAGLSLLIYRQVVYIGKEPVPRFT